MESAGFHVPVMVREVFEAMKLPKGGVYVDGTLGHGGHALEAAKFIQPGGTVYGFDWDIKMLEIAKGRISGIDNVHWNTFNIPFFDAPELLSNLNVRADGILLDLGVNSGHFDDPSRGFSFKEGPLSMKMNESSGEPASAFLNRMTPYEIESVLLEYGDERWARAIAKQIVTRRKEKPLRTTTDLVDCVLAAIPAGARDKRIHPATRTFQAIRVLTNSELDRLEEAFMGFAEILAKGGVLVILSYHSGEDRIAKQFIKRETKSKDSHRFVSLFEKPIQPSAQEIRFNHRARSARMRAIQKVA